MVMRRPHSPASRRRWARTRRWPSRASAADRLVPDGGAHEVVEPDEADQPEADLERAADRRLELEDAAERPARRPGGADELGADEDRHRDQRRDVEPVQGPLVGWGLS